VSSRLWNAQIVFGIQYVASLAVRNLKITLPGGIMGIPIVAYFLIPDTN